MWQWRQSGVRRRGDEERGSVAVPIQLKLHAKRTYANGTRLISRVLFRYSPARLRSAIGSLGIGAGDTVLVHSGFHARSGFTGSAGDVVDLLLDIVGPDGNLVMMSIPYRGSSQRYLEADPVFEVRRTPSAVGLISEVFRRRDGVVRSANPLHPLLAHGPLAAWLVADHDKCAYSCGVGSPFERFLNFDGKVLFYDAPFSALTFMHYVEHMFRHALPVPLYAADAVAVRVRPPTGPEIVVRQYYFSAAARARRDFSVIEQALTRSGELTSVRVGNTRLLSVTARSVVDCAARLVQEGSGFYR